MRIALATCAKLPGWEIDDTPLHRAFATRNVEIALPVWTDPEVDWSSFDACLLRTTWDYQERLDEFLAWATRVAGVTRLLNPLPVVRWNTHKRYLRDLEQRGVPVAPTVWLDAGSRVNVGDVLAERGWSKAFIKPAVGSTARETMRFDTSGVAAAQSHLDRLLPNEDMLLQPYLHRVETDGELSAIFIDGSLSHAVRKVPANGDYRVQDDFGAHDEPVELNADERAVAEHALAAAGFDVLYARTDFLRDDDGGLRLTELELVEPSLFFRHCLPAADRLAEALCRRIAG